MKTLYLICFAYLIISVQMCFAQTPIIGGINGKIIDENNSPLSFASVILKTTGDKAVYRTAMSNDLGAYAFTQLNAGSYFIEFKMMGYETLIKQDIILSDSLSNVTVEVIQLKPSSKMLSEVVIKADIPFIERRADKIIVNLNEGLTAGASIMEVMNKLPGVNVSMQDQISLNGKSVTVYIDGRISPLSGDALASFLKGMSSSNIEKVELIANPSSKYDAAGSGGIINIVRKRNTKEGLIGSLNGGFQQGRYGRHSGGITLNTKNKLYNLFFNTSCAYTKYFIDSESLINQFSATNKLLSQSHFLSSSVRDNRVLTPSAGFDFYLSKKTTLSVSTSASVTGYNKFATTNVTGSDENQVAQSHLDLTNNAATRSHTNISNIHLLHKLDSSGKEFTADVDYSFYRNNSDLSNADKLYSAGGTYVSGRNELLDQDGTIGMYALKLDYTRPIDKLTNLEIGLKSSHVLSNNANLFYNVISGVSSPDNSRNDKFRYSEHINAVYLNLNKKYDKLSFQLGVRGEHTSGEGQQFQTDEAFTNRYLKIFPSMSFDYKLNSKHGLTVHFNKRITRPTYENLNPLLRIINSSSYSQGNPALRPVDSYNSSINYSYKNEFFVNLHYDRGLREIMTLTTLQPGTSTYISSPANNRYSNYFRAYVTYSKRLKSWWTSSNSIQIFQQQYKSEGNERGLSSSGIPASDISSYQEFKLSDKLTVMGLLKYKSKFQSRNITTQANCYASGGASLKVFGTKGSLSVQLVDMFRSYNNEYTENSVLVNQLLDNSYDTRILYTSLSYNFGKGRVKSVNKGNAAEEERGRTTIKEN